MDKIILNFTQLNMLPVVITTPGEYKTRRGESVKIKIVGQNPHGFNCVGTYSTGEKEHWHHSGRIFFGQTCQNDIVEKIS